MDAIIPEFVAAFIKELAYPALSQPQMPVHTIFLGGGTPSLLTPEQYQQIFAAIHEHYAVAPAAEISLEANPNDLSLDYLAGLRAAGFNRLSIGMQSAIEQELRLYNRRHDGAMVAAAVDMAKAAGFNNISLDLIYGTPHQTLPDWEMTLATAIGYQPQHISLYGLELKGGTPLTKDVKMGKLPQPDDDLAADMYDMATEKLAQAGFEQYEISNWCLPGFAAQHNLQYWHNLPYLGFGPGAHGYAGGCRTIVMRLPQRYIAALQDQNEKKIIFPRTPATSKITRVTREADIAETIMMGLRLTKEGIQRAVFAARFGVDMLDLHRPTIEKFVNYGLLEVTPNLIRLTQAGRLVSNAVIREMI
jgi:oxygen-independent coproporphyrinogen-3 oxidase